MYIYIYVLRTEICFLLSFRLGTSSLLQNISYISCMHTCTMFKFRAVAIRRERLIGSLQVDVLSLVVDRCVVMNDYTLLLGMSVSLEL